MKRFLILAAVAAVAAVLGVSAVRAAPIPGGTHVSGTYSPPDYLFLGAAGGGDGLTNLGCPFVLHDYGDAAEGTLTATYNGWIGPIDQNTFAQQVLLRSHLSGTVQDVAGNSYTARGNFTDNSTHADAFSDLQFDGVGKIRLSGPAGVVAGTAEFRFVEGPPEDDLLFTSIKTCTI